MSAAAAASCPSPFVYERRDPSEGPLHQLLSDKLDDYLDARADRPLPGFVVHTLRGFLRCGVLRHGIARFRCDDCAQSRLLALSCKQRAFCPRCVGRKMADQAKHLVENVLPPVPFRQWVMSFPHALRWRMAHNHDLALGVWRVVRSAIDDLYIARAARIGPPGQHDSARPGSIMAIQRFGGALNLNVHFHALYTDGSFYERSDGQVIFLPAAQPTVAEMEALVTRIKHRVVHLLERLGFGPDEDDDPDAQLLLGLGELYSDGVFNKGARKLRHGKPRGLATFQRIKAHEDGFDLDAHVTVTAGARQQLEQMVRYILRPPLKETRLTLNPDGVELTLKLPWSDGTTHIRMASERFIDRLVALVPPPRANTLLYGGLFAANARLRPLVVAYHRPGLTARKRARPANSSRSRNTPWADLMRHSFGLDVLASEVLTRRGVPRLQSLPALRWPHALHGHHPQQGKHRAHPPPRGRGRSRAARGLLPPRRGPPLRGGRARPRRHPRRRLLPARHQRPLVTQAHQPARSGRGPPPSATPQAVRSPPPLAHGAPFVRP